MINRRSSVLLVILIILAIGCILGFILFPLGQEKTGTGPYQDFIVSDVSKPQQFVIPAQPGPVVIRYRIEGIVNDSAIVSFRTTANQYGYAKFKGAVADSAVHDFYETEDIQIDYKPKGVTKGHITIKAALNW